MSLLVDTNILVYAHDQQAGARHNLARSKIKGLWHIDPFPSISTQVLQELYVNLFRKQLPSDIARRVVENYGMWNVVSIDFGLVCQAMRAAQRWQLSLWDALIVEAARRAGASELWSEDLNAGQDFAGVRVVNPLV
jgi:predicted nucleic acid-binding protein